MYLRILPLCFLSVYGHYRTIILFNEQNSNCGLEWLFLASIIRKYMKTVHLFDSGNGRSNSPGNSKKTTNIQHLLKTPLQDRDSDWIDSFLQNIDECTLQLADSEVAIANDGYPYIHVNTLESPSNPREFIIKNELETILRNGFGVVINAHKNQPDWMFSYGDLLNYQINKEFYTDDSVFSEHGKSFVVPQDEKILVGQPSEDILPQQTRQHLREYLSFSGIKNGKVLLMARNYEDEEKASQDLVFNITPNQFSNKDEYTQVMKTLAWFLPRHYSIVGVDENVLLSGFENI